MRKFRVKVINRYRLLIFGPKSIKMKYNKIEKIQYFLKYKSDNIMELNFVTNSIRTVQQKNWTIWTYFASAEAFLPKI